MIRRNDDNFQASQSRLETAQAGDVHQAVDQSRGSNALSSSRAQLSSSSSDQVHMMNAQVSSTTFYEHGAPLAYRTAYGNALNVASGAYGDGFVIGAPYAGSPTALSQNHVLDPNRPMPLPMDPALGHGDPTNPRILISPTRLPSGVQRSATSSGFARSSSSVHRGALTEAWDRLNAVQATSWNPQSNLGLYNSHFDGRHALFGTHNFANRHEYLTLAAAQQTFRQQDMWQRLDSSPSMYDTQSLNEAIIPKYPYRKRQHELVDPSIPIKDRKVKGVVAMCCICFESEITHVLYPCGHPCLCRECASVGLKECPVCRARNIRPMKFFGTLIEEVEEVKEETELNQKKTKRN